MNPHSVVWYFTAVSFAQIPSGCKRPLSKRMAVVYMPHTSQRVSPNDTHSHHKPSTYGTHPSDTSHCMTNHTSNTHRHCRQHLTSGLKKPTHIHSHMHTVIHTHTHTRIQTPTDTDRHTQGHLITVEKAVNMQSISHKYTNIH